MGLQNRMTRFARLRVGCLGLQNRMTRFARLRVGCVQNTMTRFARHRVGCWGYQIGRQDLVGTGWGVGDANV